jgi:hypothetical protein
MALDVTQPCKIIPTVNSYIFDQIELNDLFSPLYNLAPPPPPPPSPVSKLSLFLSLPLCRQSSVLTGEWVGVGEEPNQTTARMAGPLYIIQNYLPLTILDSHET